MPSLVQPKLRRKENILNHDGSRTNGGDKIVESIERIGSRRTKKKENSEYINSEE